MGRISIRLMEEKRTPNNKWCIYPPIHLIITDHKTGAVAKVVIRHYGWGYEVGILQNSLPVPDEVLELIIRTGLGDNSLITIAKKLREYLEELEESRQAGRDKGARHGR